MRRVEASYFGPLRSRLLGGLTGAVVDVGSGTGANLEHYPPSCDLTLVEPDRFMRRRLAERVRMLRPDAVVSASSADSLPVSSGSADAVVFTLLLCTVADPERALAEARRILKPGGRLVFLEHVRGEGRHARWQDRLAPLSRAVNAGCSPNRNTLAAIEAAGFSVEHADTLVIEPDWLLVNPFIHGTATAPG